MKSSLSLSCPTVLFCGAAIGALALLPATATAGPLEIARVTASSTFPPEEGASYDADKVADGKVSTSWVEGDEGSGLGSWVELDLGGDQEIDRIKVWAGMWYSADFWNRANRPKELTLTFSDGSKATCDLKDQKEAQLCTFPAKRTSSVKVQVKQVHSGTTWLDTGISEIQVFAKQGRSQVPVKGAKASSVLPTDGDGSYDPQNVFDHLVDTMWCEGSKAGDGVGEWLELQLDGTHKISKMTILNGVGGSLPAWMKANRAKKATLTFSDGSSHAVALKGSFKPETVSFPATSTSSVRITFDEVVKGKEFNDLCVSEISFAP